MKFGVHRRKPAVPLALDAPVASATLALSPDPRSVTSLGWISIGRAVAPRSSQWYQEPGTRN